MSLRRTRTIVTDVKSGDEITKIQLEADVIMTAAILGLAATTIQAQKQNKDLKAPMGIRFDMDPKDKDSNPGEWDTFKQTVAKMNRAVADYMKVNTKTLVNAGLSEAFAQGAVIMGVYNLAGHTAPPSVQTPSISADGKALYDKISKDSLGGTPMYVGRGAYTGFVDNYVDNSKKPPQKTAVGPLSTARFIAPQPHSVLGDTIESLLYPRWLPPDDSTIWNNRKRMDGPNKDTYAAWGLISGDKATERNPKINPNLNTADATEDAMKSQGMKFFPDLPPKGAMPRTDIAGYTHGLVQAIYKAYHNGPQAVPYEIAVGSQTTKLASCFACTTFMTALGYPPTSIHLGRAESWMPLFYPYTPELKPDVSELPTIRDLNNRWFEACDQYLNVGLVIMDDAHISDAGHKAARDSVAAYLKTNANKGSSAPNSASVAATLILDALTIHKSEAPRANDTLKMPS